MSLWCLIVCFSLTCCLVSGQDTTYKLVGDTTYKLVGEKVDFPGFSNEEAPTDILWKRIERHNVHKVVHFDGSEEKSFGSFEDRVTLDWYSADLSISNLRYEDSGFYDLEILTNNQHKTRRHELIVIDKVTKPTISCEINNPGTSESAGNASLLCSLPSHQSSLEFEWSTNGQINLGHVLKISLGGELDDRQYSCTVKNPLTQESAVFTAKDCYPVPKAQAGLIAGLVALAVVLLLILLVLLFFYLKKVRPNHEKSDLESHSKPGYPKVAASGSDETRVLLDRAPTFPSKHSLGHLNQRNNTLLNPLHKDEAHMNELRESIRLRSSSERRKMFEKENGKANEAEPRDIVEEEVLENNPSDSDSMNPELSASSSDIQKATENTNPEVIKMQGLDDPADSGNPNEESNDQSLSEKPEGSGFSSPPAVSPNPDHPCSDDERAGDEEKLPDILENNFVDADETTDALPENSEDEDNKASHPPAVPPKSNIVQNFFALKKVPENTNLEVNKNQVLDDPADSGNPNDQKNPYGLRVKERRSFFEKEDGKANEAEPRDIVEEEVLENNPSDSDSMNPELTAMSSESNSGSKKEEIDFEKSTPENDVQPPPVARESSPLSENSPESSPEAERKQDINSDECAKASNGESSSSSSEESENEEQAPPASTAKETDSETTVDEQKPL